jgi:hypothetical protein
VGPIRSSWTRYTELMFLHSVRSGGHVAHSSASGVQNVKAVFFILGWAWCGSEYKRAGTHYAELVFLNSV